MAGEGGGGGRPRHEGKGEQGGRVARDGEEGGKGRPRHEGKGEQRIRGCALSCGGGAGSRNTQTRTTTSISKTTPRKPRGQPKPQPHELSDRLPTAPSTHTCPTPKPYFFLPPLDTLNLKKMMSPSWTTYLRPSIRSLPPVRIAASLPTATATGKEGAVCMRGGGGG